MSYPHTYTPEERAQHTRRLYTNPATIEGRLFEEGDDFACLHCDKPIVTDGYVVVLRGDWMRTCTFTGDLIDIEGALHTVDATGIEGEPYGLWCNAEHMAAWLTPLVLAATATRTDISSEFREV